MGSCRDGKKERRESDSGADTERKWRGSKCVGMKRGIEDKRERERESKRYTLV